MLGAAAGPADLGSVQSLIHRGLHSGELHPGDRQPGGLQSALPILEARNHPSVRSCSLGGYILGGYIQFNRLEGGGATTQLCKSSRGPFNVVHYKLRLEGRKAGTHSTEIAQ